MKQNEKYLIAAAAALALLLIPKILNPIMKSAELISSFEGFSSSPYWDINRYSWGYGTPAPGATGTITRAQALQELQAHSQADYDYLSQLITRPLTNNQWAALLSFAYNTGQGNADNLVPNINAGNDAALGVQWNKYVMAGGQVNNSLVQRRAKEWQIWNS